MSMYKKQSSYRVYKDEGKYYAECKIDGIVKREPITKEIFDTCRRDNWNKNKRNERGKRCINPDGTRCQKTSCAECEKILTELGVKRHPVPNAKKSRKSILKSHVMGCRVL